ncbi:MAG: energy transducer TonB [Deltaproteobacteria bacterium]|nr:energy transducer TonB [Deltaproteobacteria bacterium]
MGRLVAWLRGVAFALAVSAPLPALAQAGPTIVPPKALSDTTVTYPEGASGEATVTLVVTVGVDGTVTDVVATEPNEPFSSRAVAVARLWTFEAATRDGKPVASKIRVEVVFRPPVQVVEPPPAEPEPAPGPVGAPAPAPPRTDEVVIRGERVEASRTVTLSRNEVRQIPGTFGDPFRAVEIMPGVTPIVTGLPFFFIRGAPPGNVGYFLDGVRVPLLFHVGAGPSVIHPGLINHVDLYPGGYPARFGRFTGGIVSGETNAPRNELTGEGNLRLFDVGALVEAPFANGRGNVVLGGRYSYTAALLTLISSDTTLDYWDYQARAHYDVGEDDRIGVFAFGSYDFLGQRTVTGQTLTVFGTEFHRVDVRHDHRLGNRGNVRTAVTLGIDRSRQADDRFVRDRMIAARTEYTYALSNRALFRAGTDVQIDSYDIDLGVNAVSPSAQRVIDFFPTRTDLASGIRADMVIGVSKIFEVTPGARVDFFASQGATAIGVDPRLALKTHVSDRTRLLTALGIVHQTPSFVVPLPGFQPGGIRGGLQKAIQESAGVEVDVAEGATATATVFHNAFYDMSDPLGSAPQQIAGCPPGAFPTGTIAGDRGQGGGGGGGQCGVPRFPVGTIGPDRSGGGGQAADSNAGRRVQNAFEVRSRGNAFGLELLFKKKLTSRLGGFFSYTLSRSLRTANGMTYVATFDRTHVLNGALAFDLGRNWRAGTRVTFYTGLPKAPDPVDPTSTRLDPFFRLDLRLEKRWQLGKTTWLSFVAEWMNATLSKEQVATTCTLRGCEAQLVGPVTIPSLGLEGGF